MLSLLTLVSSGVLLPAAFAGSEPSAGQLIPPTFASPPTFPKSGFAFGNDLRNIVPPGAEKSSLLLGDILIEGLDPTYRDKYTYLILPFKGQKRSVSDIYKLAGDVQQLYSNDGFFLNRVVIPPQHVNHGGTVKLKVVEGFISEINYSSLAPEVRDRVASYFMPLMGKVGLKGDEFQRALLLASATSGVKLKTNLKPAKEPLGVALSLTGDFDPISAQVTTSNALSESLGKFETSLSMAVNSAFHVGEQIYLNVSGAPLNGFLDASSPRRVLAVGVTAPIMNDGLQGNIEYAWSGTAPITPKSGFATASQYQRWSAKLSYPIWLNQTSSLTARVAFDDVDEVNTWRLFKFDLYHDHLSVVRAGLDYNGTFLGGVQLSTGLEVSRGVSGLGSRGPEDAKHGKPISQFGATDQFTKLQANVHVSETLSNGLTWDIAARGQYSPTGLLMNSEKFSIGGPGDLSGVDSGSWSGDHGWAVRAELQYDMSKILSDYSLTLKPYIFAARGQVYLANPSAAELDIDGATGFGIGMRGQWMSNEYRSNPIDFGFEVARNLSDHPNYTPDQWRFNFLIRARF